MGKTRGTVTLTQDQIKVRKGNQTYIVFILLHTHAE